MERGTPVLVRVGKAGTLAALFDSRSTCRGPNCGEEVLWCMNPATGKFLICDPPEDEEADPVLEPHWATCPDRELFTKRKSRGGGADG